MTMRFPVPNWVKDYPFDTDMRRFGARRDHGRRSHAGCDLYAPLNSPVVAIAPGVVVRAAPFYMKAFTVEVNHGYPLGIIRYGEITIAPGITVGKTLKPGDIIGFVRILVGPGMTGVHPMLHFEQYAGWGKGDLSNLTPKGGKFQRREDLMDPTNLLKMLQVIELANPRPRTEEEVGLNLDAQVFHRITETCAVPEFRPPQFRNL